VPTSLLYDAICIDEETHTGAKSREVYREWMSWTRPAPSPRGLRRPGFLMRPVTPQVQAYYVDGMSNEESPPRR